MSLPITTSVIVDPTYHSNKRTEFKLYNKGRVFLPTLRIVNFGVDVPDVNHPNFCITGGLNSIIKQITLYFNDIVVQQVKDASQYLSIKNLHQNTYTVFRNANNNLVGSSLVLERKLEDTSVLQLLKGTSKLTGYLNLVRVFPLLDAMLTDFSKTTNSGLLADISEIRVSIEYETDATKIFTGEDLPGAWSISEPQIIYTELFNMDAPTSFQYTVACMESERFNLLGNNNKQSIRLRAFDGKILSSLLFQCLPGNQGSNLMGYQYSQQLLNEIVNLSVNSTVMLPFQGCDNEAKKLSWTSKSQALGSFFSPILSAMTNYQLNAWTQYDDRLKELAGKLSYLGLDVNRLISRLDYETSFNGGEVGAVTVYAYGHVLKTVTKNGPVIMTTYMS